MSLRINVEKVSFYWGIENTQLELITLHMTMIKVSDSYLCITLGLPEQMIGLENLVVYEIEANNCFLNQLTYFLKHYHTMQLMRLLASLKII